MPSSDRQAGSNDLDDQWDVDLGDALYIPGQDGDPTRWERGVHLRPILPEDFRLIYSWSTSPDVARTWRYRGATPQPEQFAEHLWAGVLCQYIAESVDGRPLGLASLYDANQSARHSHFSCIVADWARRSGAALGIALSMLGHGFRTWPFEKFYMETNSYGLEHYKSAVERGFFIEEARLRRYELFGDEWADLIYLSIDRDQFRSFSESFGGA